MSTDKASPARFATLDALRGVAAFAVLFYHMRTLKGGGEALMPAFASGYLAVDLFFLMSGFVISHAYAKRLCGHMTVGTFMKARFVRLQPVIAIGTLLGFAVAVYKRSFELEGAPGILEIATTLPTSLLLLPNILVPWGIFLFNPPAWSLFYELLAGALYATSLRSSWLRHRYVLPAGSALLLTSGTALVFSALRLGSLDHGSVLQDWPVASARIAFSFMAGVLLHATRSSWLHRLPSIPTGWLMAACILSLMPPVTGRDRIAYDILFTLVLSPALVMLGTASTAKPHMQRVANILGMLSYPLYAVHAPVKHAFETANITAPFLLMSSILIASISMAGLTALADPVLRMWLAKQLDRIEKPSFFPTCSLKSSR